MARELDIGLVAWSALGGGMVTGKYNRETLDSNQPHRLIPHVKETDNFWHAMTKRNMAIMDNVMKVADEIGRPPVQIALRFLMQQDVVSIPIFSARTFEQAQEDLGCLDFTLTDEQMQKLDNATAPAISSVMPESGPYPYPMLEYGTPALAGFYSRALLFGNVEYKIMNHHQIFSCKYHPESAKSAE